ncbi:AsmA-like C-terminal domain-containing protein [Kordiimonas lacus]|nr:AsmA-like C-terminal domain-containing protein [Kordiimonas lacus]
MKKSLGIMVRTGVWVATAAVLLACLLFARLLFAPIDMGFARDEIIGQAEGILPGWKIEFDQTEIGWDWRSVRPWISITNLRLTDRADRLTARVPRARVGVAFSSILGDIGLSSVELDAPNVLVTDLAGFSDATGSSGFSDLFGDSGLPKPAVFRPVTEAFSRFAKRLTNQAPDLDNILLTSSVIEIVRGDEFQNARFAVPRLELNANGDLLSLAALADVMLGNRPVQLQLQGEAEPEVGELTVSVAFSQMNPSDLSFQANMPEVVTYLDFPVTLGLDFELASNVGLRSARFHVGIDEGFVSHPVRFPEAAPVTFGSIDGYYVASEDMVVIEELEVQAGARLVTGSGVFQWFEELDEPSVKLMLQTDAATIPEIKSYWPVATYPDGTPRGARVWVDENMIQGTARNVSFHVDWSPTTGGAFAKGSAIQLDFEFDGIDTKYLREMPPIENAIGHGRLTREEFDIEITAGSVLGMPIGGSTAHMYDIHMPGQGTGEFNVKLTGPVPTIMDLIAYDPLNVPQKIDFDPTRLDGTADVDVAITVPLIKGVPKEDVGYRVEAHLRGTSVRDLLGGEGLRDGSMILQLDGDRLSLAGDARLNGVPVSLYWREDFAAGRDNPEAETTEVVLVGEFDETDIQAFGVDISDFLEGKAVGEATFIGRNFKFSRGYFTADTTDAVLKASQLAWRKPVSSPAMVTGTLVLRDEGTSLSPLVVQGENVDLVASFDWGSRESGRLDGDFTIRQMGNHQLAGTVVQRAGKPTKVNIVAATFDAGVYLRELDDAPATPSAAANEAEQKGDDVDIKLLADRLLLLNGEALEKASLETRFKEGEPKTLSFTGFVPGTEKQVVMTVGETDDPAGQAISLTSPDAGHILRGLGLFAHLRDGSLNMSGLTSGWGDRLHMEGEAKVRDSLMVSQENLGPGVKEGVVSGLNDYLSDGPVSLDKIDVPFDYTNSLLDLSGLKANGPTLGMTMEGQISAREDKINVNGVFVPAYGLNSLLGKIPILGALLTGGEGKGVFGVSYRVKGQLENPEFTINPVSGLAPGFLRLLFEGRKGKIADVELEPDPETAPVDPADFGTPDGTEPQPGADGGTAPKAEPTPEPAEDPSDEPKDEDKPAS